MRLVRRRRDNASGNDARAASFVIRAEKTHTSRDGGMSRLLKENPVISGNYSTRVPPSENNSGIQSAVTSTHKSNGARKSSGARMKGGVMEADERYSRIKKELSRKHL
jgi:hypothetical protein